MPDPDLLPIESVPSLSRNVSAQRVVNAYAERQKAGGRGEWVRYGSPGIVTALTVGDGPLRGMHEMNGVLYAVSGTKLYSIASNYVATELGVGIVGTAPVDIADNGTQLMIVNGDFGWTWDATLGLQQATSIFFYPASTVEFFDDYFVFPRNDTNQFFRSELLDGQSYVFDNFASAESSSDRVIAVRALVQYLYIMGEHTIEPWYDAGAADFPFRRIEGGAIRRGIAAPLSSTEFDSKIFFLGDDRCFYQLGGTSISRLSNHALEQTWQKYERVDDAFVVKIAWNGHKFVNLTFPSANATWCFDLASGLWHERESLDDTRNPIRWRVNCSATAYGKTWVGDYLTGQVGYLSDSVYTEFGEDFVTEFVLPNISNGNRRGFMPSFTLEVEAGVGLNNGQGSDPLWQIDWSNDGATTWVPHQLHASMGPIGVADRRVVWNGLGTFYQRTMRLRCSEPVKRVAIAARAPRLYWGISS